MNNEAPQQPVASIPMEALVKEHNVLVTLAAENIELRAALSRMSDYIAALEKKVVDLSGETNAAVPEAEEGA